MKIPENFEYLFEYNNLDFYAVEEYGFTQKKLAMKHHLYEDFGNDSHSTYYEILCFNLYDDKKISQIWAFKDETPVALGMAIHHETEKIITDSETNLKGSVLGHIHLYTTPEYRKQGISREMILPLETMLLAPTQFPPCTVLQDRAYDFSQYLKHSWGLPFGMHVLQHTENKKYLIEHYNKLFEHEELLNKYQKKYPEFWNEFNNQKSLKQKMTM